MDGLTWVTPPRKLAKAIGDYGDRVNKATLAVAGFIASKMQGFARANAPWEDRTGNARSGLFGTAEYDAARRVVIIFLSHGPVIDYGVDLELAHGGKHAIIMRTIEAHLPELNQMLRNMLK
jgi:hypothetical protein